MKTVIIVGGGLVGSLEACYMAKKNFKVELYEMRQDIRGMEIVRGRSINLALSVRGIEALKRVGLDQQVLQDVIPMYARMIHDRDGTTRPIPYGKKHQIQNTRIGLPNADLKINSVGIHKCINSVDRRQLNEVLLTAAEKYTSVSLHFEHKLLDCDFDEGCLTFQRSDGSIIQTRGDLIVGCDGAFSAIRRQMMKKTLFDYQQVFIPHGYMELNMPPTNDDKFAMAVNYLHIWARNEYMMIALPNQDKSFTVTLFMPFDIFKQLNTETAILNFFRENFEDSIPLLGEKQLVETVLNSKALPMVSVKCSPHHVTDKAVILGDAAHAMVPFYGQGMNCGFEDCIVFDDLMNKYNNQLDKVLPEYTSQRSVDAKAMCDLAFYNYIEMRESVNSWSFLLRKKVDNFLYRFFPKMWMPLYTSVSFSRTRYHECIKNKEWQDKVIRRCVYTGVPLFCVGGYLVYRHVKDTSILDNLAQLVDRLKPRV